MPVPFVSPDLWLAEVDVMDPLTETVETRTFATGEGYQTDPERENLSPRSEELDHADWTKSRTTVGTNADVAPDGTTTADRLIEDSTASATHRAYSANLITITDGATVVVSRFLKPGTRTWALLGLIDSGESKGARVYFNLATGEIGSNVITGSGPTIVGSGILRNPNWRGYLRCWVAVTLGAGVTGARHYLGLASADNGANFSGDGASYLSAWGAQTEDNCTGPSDYIKAVATAVTRPNPNVTYEARIAEAINVRRDLFDVGTTSGHSRTAVGDLTLLNGDGALDDLVDFGFDGRAVRILRAPAEPRPEYPLGFTTVFVGTMHQAEFSRDLVTIKVRDEQSALLLPIQSDKYAGDNALPDGLEGVEDLEGKPKPLTFGKVLNVSAPCVNTAKLIYQIHDGALDSVEDVYDKGISLKVSPTDWSDTSSFVNLTDTRSLAFGDGLWVAGGIGGGTTRIETSPDGETWTARTNPFAAGNIVLGLAYSPTLDLWVAVAGAGEIATSPDATTWTARTSGTAEILNSVAWCPNAGIFVAVGNNAVCLTSTDGTTWTSRTSGFTASPIWGVVEGVPDATQYSVPIIVIAGEDGKIATSPDGTTWTLRTSQFDTTDILTATFGQGLFLVAGLEGKIATSRDGVNWTKQNSGVDPSITYTQFLYATHGAGWFVVSNNSLKTVVVSRDGVNWESFATGASGSGYEIAYSPTLEAFGLTDGGTFRNTPDVGTYASEADLLDDDLAPNAGTYKVYLAGGYIRLGSPPAGLVTVDATEGDTAADRTVAQVFKRILTLAGYTTGDWNATDLTTLDTAENAVIGVWVNEETTISDVLDQVAKSIGAAWWVDASGVFRIAQLTLPTTTAELALTASDIVLNTLDRIRTNDADRGIPIWRVILRYAKNYTVQTTDVAFGVEDARRAVIAKPWLEVEASDADIQTLHPLAPELIVETLLAEQADAQAEATRLLALRGTRRDLFEATIAYDASAAAVELMDVVSVTHERFGLSYGKKFRTLSLAPDAKTRQLTVGLWGGPASGVGSGSMTKRPVLAGTGTVT